MYRVPNPSFNFKHRHADSLNGTPMDMIRSSTDGGASISEAHERKFKKPQTSEVSYRIRRG